MAEQTCPACAAILTGTRYCRNCGSEVRQTEPPGAPPGLNKTPAGFCTGCGAPVAEARHFCLRCGKPARQTKAAPPPTVPEPPVGSTRPPATANEMGRRNSSRLWLAAPMLALAAAAIGGVWLFSLLHRHARPETSVAVESQSPGRNVAGDKLSPFHREPDPAVRTTSPPPFGRQRTSAVMPSRMPLTPPAALEPQEPPLTPPPDPEPQEPPPTPPPRRRSHG